MQQKRRRRSSCVFNDIKFFITEASALVVCDNACVASIDLISIKKIERDAPSITRMVWVVSIHGTIRDELKLFEKAIYWSFEEKNNDIYNYINGQLDGELSGGFDEVIRLEYSPDDTINKERIKILEDYAKHLPTETFRYYEELYSCATDSQKGIFYMLSVTAFYAFREKIKDTFLVFCSILGDHLQDKDNYKMLIEHIISGTLQDFLFKFFDENDLLLTKEMF